MSRDDSPPADGRDADSERSEATDTRQHASADVAPELFAAEDA